MTSPIFDTLANIQGKVLVTGHTGFKGLWLTLFLQEIGLEVVGLSIDAESNSIYRRGNREGSIEEYFIDIREFHEIDKALKKIKPTFVFHLAAETIVLDSYSRPESYFSTNVMGTVNLLKSCASMSSVRGLLVTTTDKVYENLDTHKFFKESDPLKGAEPYSSSKVATENVLDAWRAILTDRNQMKVSSARSGNVVGGGDFAPNRLLPDLIRAIESDKSFVIRNPRSTRPWQHVCEPVIGYLLMANKMLQGEDIRTLNFGPNGESLTVRRVVEVALNAWTGKAPSVVQTSEKSEEAKHEASYLQLNSTLAKERIGWESRYSQEDAITRTISWWNKVLLENASPIEACISDIADYLGTYQSRPSSTKNPALGS
jgi:CDP-glucose 4,6-dehydratase